MATCKWNKVFATISDSETETVFYDEEFLKVEQQLEHIATEIRLIVQVKSMKEDFN